MRIVIARILLAVFLFSVSIIPMIEAGHELLHSFENPFHHHAIAHTAKSHSSFDHHHFSKMKFAYQMYEEDYTPNLVWFAYSFFKESENFKFAYIEQAAEHFTPILELEFDVTLLPLAPPPQGLLI